MKSNFRNENLFMNVERAKVFLGSFAISWEQRKFRDTFIFLQNNALSRADLANEGSVMNVHYGDVLIKYGEVLDVAKSELTYLIDSTVVRKYQSSILQNGDMIIADAAEDETVGKCCEIAGLTTETILSGLHTIPCRPLLNFAEGYLGYYMNSTAYHDQLLPLMQGTKVSSIGKSAIQETEIFYPKSETEQKQIGLYFRHLDHLITLHQRKYSIELRFFASSNIVLNEPESISWEQRKVSDVAEITAGGTPSTSVDRYWFPKEIPWLSSGEVHKKYVTYTDDKISREGMINSSARIIPQNSVLIALAGQGKTRGTVAINRIPLATNQSIAAMSFESHIIPEFIFSNLEGRYEEIRKMSSGDGSRGGLNKQIVGEIIIPYTSIQEQAVVGSFFSHLDHLITLHQRELEKLQNIKKSCLEKMFV